MKARVTGTSEEQARERREGRNKKTEKTTTFRVIFFCINFTVPMCKKNNALYDYTHGRKGLPVPIK